LTTTSAAQAAFATQLALLPQSMPQRLSAVHAPPLGQAPAPLQSRLQLLPASQRTAPWQALSVHVTMQSAPTEVQSTRCEQLSEPQLMLQEPLPPALQRAVSQLPSSQRTSQPSASHEAPARQVCGPSQSSEHVTTSASQATPALQLPAPLQPSVHNWLALQVRTLAPAQEFSPAQRTVRSVEVRVASAAQAPAPLHSMSHESFGHCTAAAQLSSPLHVRSS
jgi:hypothetical protein